MRRLKSSVSQNGQTQEFCMSHMHSHMYMNAEHSILKIVGNLQSVGKHIEKERHEFVQFPRIKVSFQSVFTHLQIIRYRLTFFSVCGFLFCFFKLNEFCPNRQAQLYFYFHPSIHSLQLVYFYFVYNLMSVCLPF